jgi:hypothetical protein
VVLLQIAMEFGTTSRLAQGTAAAVQFGVDPQDALDKISKLQERLSTLEQVRRAEPVVETVLALACSSQWTLLVVKQLAQHWRQAVGLGLCVFVHSVPWRSWGVGALVLNFAVLCCRLCWSSARSLVSVLCARCLLSGLVLPAR